MKTLVTGGAGFVGRHLVRRLLERGDHVACVDFLADGTGCVNPADGWPLFEPRDFKNFEFHPVDCRSFFADRPDTDFDYAFHLAAIVGGRLTIERDPLAVAVDLSLDSEFYRWAAKARPKKIGCFSSSAAYPIRLQTEQHHMLLREDMIDFNKDLGLPDMSYGWAKLTSEYLALLAYERYGLESAIYRPFSGYGEDQSLDYPYPSICERVFRNQDKDRVQVWGTGEQMRDFIHIEDCVDGILLTVDQLHHAEAINLSTGILTSFIELARLAADVAGYKPQVSGMSDKPTGVFARGGECTKQKKLGFQPKITLRNGLERAFAYFERNGSLGNKHGG
jgi:nucleoside-diphosphate-sugar epimerase